VRPIELRIPNRRPYHGVARLVLGGLAARHELSYETLEDLQLALVTVLEEDAYATGDEISVELDVGEDAITMSIGPLDGEALRAELAAPEEEDLGLGRVLATLVEEVEVEARDDGDWLRFAKRVRGVDPAGANA
jgi:anti-sigma regulatory factor (Ser/Thr protein kinase)